MKEELGFLETMVVASPPILGTLAPSNDGHIVDLDYYLF